MVTTGKNTKTKNNTVKTDDDISVILGRMTGQNPSVSRRYRKHVSGMRTGKKFTAEDVRKELTKQGCPTVHPNWWGSQIRPLVNSGLIEEIGFVRPSEEGSHGSVVRRYQRTDRRVKF